jgi:hypothetical protein
MATVQYNVSSHFCLNYYYCHQDCVEVPTELLIDCPSGESEFGNFLWQLPVGMAAMQWDKTLGEKMNN